MNLQTIIQQLFPYLATLAGYLALGFLPYAAPTSWYILWFAWEYCSTKTSPVWADAARVGNSHTEVLQVSRLTPICLDTTGLQPDALAWPSPKIKPTSANQR